MEKKQRYVVRLRNIPKDASKYDISRILMQFNNITHVFFPDDTMAYILFSNQADMLHAQNTLNGYILNGIHTLFVTL
jgi:RNA recognition motif-containing protein